MPATDRNRTRLLDSSACVRRDLAQRPDSTDSKASNQSPWLQTDDETVKSRTRVGREDGCPPCNTTVTRAVVVGDSNRHVDLDAANSPVQTSRTRRLPLTGRCRLCDLASTSPVAVESARTAPLSSSPLTPTHCSWRTAAATPRFRRSRDRLCFNPNPPVEARLLHGLPKNGCSVWRTLDPTTLRSGNIKPPPEKQTTPSVRSSGRARCWRTVLSWWAGPRTNLEWRFCGPIVQRRIGSRLYTHAHMHMRTYRPVLPLDLSMPLLGMGLTARHLPVTDGARRRLESRDRSDGLAVPFK
ncbi:unnamed protein product [Protopolystoma xenopodis]|uniref:Uncharacterized protein n=1 Tax=Protopolystoma xenopodis TaxID=117903 RepID=A0A3S5C188_9PLAT|nr:unnamed protein product [Protopolystoma xenopodis]